MEEIESALEQFTGTERYYPHMGKLLLTDGAKFLAGQARCYWLYDIAGASARASSATHSPW